MQLNPMSLGYWNVIIHRLHLHSSWMNIEATRNFHGLLLSWIDYVITQGLTMHVRLEACEGRCIMIWGKYYWIQSHFRYCLFTSGLLNITEDLPSGFWNRRMGWLVQQLEMPWPSSFSFWSYRQRNQGGSQSLRWWCACVCLGSGGLWS